MFTRVTDWVAYNAKRFPNAVAVDELDGGGSLTWSEFEDQVGRLARVLIDGFRVGVGDRVGLLSEDDWHVLALQSACIRAGAVFVPFNWRLAESELEVLAKDAELSLFVHDRAWAGSATRLAGQLGVRSVGWSAEDGGQELTALVAEAEHLAAPSNYSADQLAQILYTSGTTGLPKGAMITVGGLIANTLNMSADLALVGPASRYLSLLPFFHAAGLNAQANPTLITGGRVTIMGRFDPARAVALLGDPAHGITNTSGAPVMWRMMMDAAPAEADFSHLVTGQVGGGAIPADVGTYFSERGVELQAGWGATEMGPNATVMPREYRLSKRHTVGFPVQHLELRVVDPVTGLDVELGEEGEAWVRGPAITPGYWRREPEDPVAAADGWFKSGDAVSMDADGFVTLRGRFKDMYKSGGENVFCAEVERIITSLDSVQDVAIVGRPDERWGEVGVAFIVPAPGATVVPDEVLTHCADRLAKYKVPVEVILVEDLPRNVTGKIQKQLLRSRFA